MSIQSSRLMHELEQEKLKLEGDIDLLQSNQVYFQLLIVIN